MAALRACTRDLRQTPGSGDTVDFDHVERHNREVHLDIHPAGMVPARPFVGGLRRLVRLAGLGAVAAAIVTERRKPPDEREWHGRLAGFIPYDFRRPTMDRVRSSLWDTESPRLISPQVFGVGWTLNVGRLVHLVRQRLGGCSDRR